MSVRVVGQPLGTSLKFEKPGCTDYLEIVNDSIAFYWGPEIPGVRTKIDYYISCPFFLKREGEFLVFDDRKPVIPARFLTEAEMDTAEKLGKAYWITDSSKVNFAHAGFLKDKSSYGITTFPLEKLQIIVNSKDTLGFVEIQPGLFGLFPEYKTGDSLELYHFESKAKSAKLCVKAGIPKSFFVLPENYSEGRGYTEKTRAKLYGYKIKVQEKKCLLIKGERSIEFQLSTKEEFFLRKDFLRELSFKGFFYFL